MYVLVFVDCARILILLVALKKTYVNWTRPEGKGYPVDVRLVVSHGKVCTLIYLSKLELTGETES